MQQTRLIRCEQEYLLIAGQPEYGFPIRGKSGGAEANFRLSFRGIAGQQLQGVRSGDAPDGKDLVGGDRQDLIAGVGDGAFPDRMLSFRVRDDDFGVGLSIPDVQGFFTDPQQAGAAADEEPSPGA